jgi:Flp pilus assembly protein TadD
MTKTFPSLDNDITPEALVEKSGKDVKFEGVNASVEKTAKKALDDGNFAKAAQYYKQLMNEDPKSDVYHLAYAEALRRSGDYGMALNTYESFIRKHPESLVAHEGRGLTLLAQGEVTRSLEVLDTVRQRDNTRWRTLNGIGVGLTIQKKNEDALQYFREALKHSENNPSILNNIGLTLAVMDDYPRALKALEMAVRMHKGPEKEREHIDLNRAMVMGISGDMDGAEKVAGQYLKKPELYNNLGYYAYLANDKELAKTYLNMALTQSPEYYKKAWDNLQQVMKK